MRIYLFLTLAITLMSFYAGYLSLNILNSSRIFSNATLSIEIEQELIKNKFQETHKTVHSFETSELIKKAHSLELLNPELLYPQYANYELDEIQALNHYHMNCNSSFKTRKDLRLNKAWIWEDIYCQKKSLPKDFFTTPPYMHPSGNSYARLAWLEKNKLGLKDDWQKSNLKFFHWLELDRIALNSSLDSLRKIISEFSSLNITSLLNQDNLIVDKNSVLIRNKTKSKFNNSNHSSEPEQPITIYDIYSAKDWNSFIAHEKFKAISNPYSSECLYKDGNVCWVSNEASFYQKVQKPSLVLLFISLIFTAVAAFFSLKKFRNHKFNEEKKRFALQALIHELRTPASSLILYSDLLLKKFDKIDFESQEILLNLSNDIQRLKRLAENSKHYLTTDNQEKLLQLNPVKIPSLNDFFSNILSPYLNRIQMTLLDQDQSFILDPYWIDICARNLVENSLNHGTSPTIVRLSVVNGYLELTIEDQGILESKNLKELTRPFKRKSTSQGLGLGLTIVHKVIKEMKGELTLKENPTLFTIRLEELNES